LLRRGTTEWRALHYKGKLENDWSRRLGSCRVQKPRTLAQDTVSGKHDLVAHDHVPMRQCYDHPAVLIRDARTVPMRATLMHSCNSALETQQTPSKALEIRASILFGCLAKSSGDHSNVEASRNDASQSKGVGTIKRRYPFRSGKVLGT